MKDFKEFSELKDGNQWFTSDLHFGDPRLELYSRDLIAKDSDEIDDLIIKNFNKKVKSNDIIYFLGDISYDTAHLELLNQLNGYKILIKGNYDDKIPDEELDKYFHEIYSEKTITIGGTNMFLNHYPKNCKSDMFNICGHIHEKWKVQRNAINVGVDAWHMFPVSEKMLLFFYNAIKNHYDDNVFAGEYQSNLKNIK